MPGKALRLWHSQNNQPWALGAAYFGNASTLGLAKPFTLKMYMV
jgi:hypothetical protein